ncbi:response regulator [Dictyobacter aurantiacus]|uniref:Response regulator n=1 Tax=Dictyobacter aurantiacus TaxID=1936993 RepID=A0A401ZTK4_9CHLR|nr:response regulator [Dictyobacter aurantiacus]GCE10104.1 response regulator [Dictyobacter aurantiacus]
MLIVEDDPDIGEMLVAFLQDATVYQVTHVLNGFEALTMVQAIVPCLILLDYHLPGMNGLECLDLLRASKGVEETPIIFMSAAVPHQAQIRLDLTILEKPFDMETLLDLITHLLTQS